MEMVKNRIAYAIFLSILPVTAFGSMAYVPSRPCDCVLGCGYTAETAPNGYGADGWNYYRGAPGYHDFRRVQPVETPDEQLEQPTQQPQQQNSTSWQDTGMYVAANLIANMWSWKNTYDSNYGGVDLSQSQDKYSFENVWAGSVALGMKFDENLRGDIELGITREFEDSDEVAKYTLSEQYAMANVYRDFDSGFYLGAGLGVAKVTAGLGGALFGSETLEESVTSIKVGLSAGYAMSIADNMFIDFRYRLSGLKNADISNSSFLWDETEGDYLLYSLHIKSDYLVENAFSVGIRFNF
ncbi:MAG: outer membrane beta-barrel protein [Alphaproteobacteria bacterium]|nr:outer membrane beta-barrel protein [Alphaproteobacteria bacterium]